MNARFLKKFEDEIQLLERELKMELPKEIQRARELGDLRENAEYQAARERQSFIQARLGMLRKRMGEIAMMNFDRLPRDRAAFGSTIEVRTADGEVVSYQLVMPEDADPAKGWISTASPIGRSLMGRAEGDLVTVPTPAGVREFEVVRVSTIHDE